MTAPVAASERELPALAGIVSKDRPDAPARRRPPSPLAALMGQVRRYAVAFSGFGGEHGHDR